MSFKKDPNAVLDYSFDWAPYLAPLGDAIASVVWIASAGLTLGAASSTGTTATTFVLGGIAGNDETLTCRITTAGGRTDDRTITLKITDR